jgi:hypothetical protein
MIALLLPEILSLMGVSVSASAIAGIETGAQLVVYLIEKYPAAYAVILKIAKQIWPNSADAAELLSMKMFLPHKMTTEEELRWMTHASDVGSSGGG